MTGGATDDSLYAVLEVDSQATFDEIEAAYAELQGVLAGNGLALYSIVESEDTEQLKEKVELAYRTLRDPDRRAAYDRHLREEGEYPSLTVLETRSARTSTSRGTEGSKDEHDTPASRAAEAEPAASVSPDAPPPMSEPASQRVVAPKKVDRKLSVDPAIPITAEQEFSGALLRRLRESASASIADVAEITKVGKNYLKAIEDNDFDSLPAPVYVRGFVVEYAKVLGLNSSQVAASYMALYERYRNGGK